VLGIAARAGAENFQVLQDSTDASHQGYTVVRVWGTHREMGRAVGKAFAAEIDAFLPKLRSTPNYPAIRTLVASTVWSPQLEDEIAGIVDGVKAGVPASTLDAVDVKALNSFSDWSYGVACRSHSAWGHFVQAPVKTLSTRRLDFGTPFDLALHHVVYAFEPSDGSPRWVNLSWPGVVTVITGVNAQGTLSSLHDFNSGTVSGSGLTFRSVAARRALTEPDAATLDGQRDQATSLLGALRVATGTFINFFAPEGHGAVYTCAAGAACGAPRRPQSDYYSGDVLVTANAQTTGHSVPSGAEFIDAYYAQGGVKTLESHFSLMGTTGLHLLSLAYRGAGDMSIWVNGRGRSDRLELEWKDLFPAAPAGPDAGTVEPPAADAGQPASPDASQPAPGPDATVTPAGPDAGAAVEPRPDSGATLPPAADATTPGPASADSGSPPPADQPPAGGCGTRGSPMVLMALGTLGAVLLRRKSIASRPALATVRLRPTGRK
jgi:hypothetical protein